MTTTTSSSGGPRQQQPLPGGCHGRSSRHNSYCRRQPCYNGSKYCKLHYRQYVVRAATTATAAAAEQEQDEQVLKSPSAARSSSKVTMTSTSTSTTPQHHQHQDRRYMGAPGEIRCLATTTRGRACAYISVHGTKYCYLHSDYDTNPPPRRGGCGTPVLSTAKADDHHHGQAATATTTASSTTTTTTTTSARLAEKKGLKRRSRRSPVNGSNSAKLVSPRPASAALSEVSIPSVSSEESSAKERKKTPSRRTSAKLKEKHADSPFPLLSMISTDQWGQKKVRIATGPFEGRSGEVKKWGNGWVSVRIPGVGLHNRRSFELYLHSDEDAQKTTARSSNEQDTNNIDDAKSLFRCVSHDAGSPSPAATVTPRPVKSALTTVTNGPKMPHVMETPKRAPKTVIKSVTPSVLQKPRVEATVPLVDSLLISPAGVVDGACVASSKKFDMLFGTAALERSRRSIHKPTRYEDTEMLEKKRSRDEGDDRPAAEKRPCIEAAK